jgi:hypothetical protein
MKVALILLSLLLEYSTLEQAISFHLYNLIIKRSRKEMNKIKPCKMYLESIINSGLDLRLNSPLAK